LCVGGSTTECLYLDQSEAWPALVQAGLAGDAWVANAGISGRSTRDHLVQLEHLLPQLEPLDRVVLLVGVNDLQLVLGQGRDYDPTALDAPGARRALLPRAFEVLPPEYRDATFPRSTCLWRFVVPRVKGLRPSSQVQDGAGQAYVRWRRYRASSPQVLEALPDLEAGLAEFRANVADLARLCRDAGASPLFLTQPFLWAPDSPPEHRRLFWMGGVGPYQQAPGASYYSCAALAEGMQRYNAALRELCLELGADFFDLAARVPPEAAYFYDGVHFNEAGARLVADQVTASLR
jgi:lysophospholipase L1-like esterase